MGKRKFRLSVQRKNYERKRWGLLPVRLPVKGGSSTFNISVPLDALSDAQKTALLNQPSLSPIPTSSVDFISSFETLYTCIQTIIVRQ